MRRERVGEHVGAVSMGAAVVLRARLPFRIGLDEEPAEVGDRAIDFVGLVPPPAPDCGIERVGGLQPADLDRRREARREIDPDAVRPPRVGQRRHLGEIAGVRICALALTLLRTTPLIPIDALARA